MPFLTSTNPIVTISDVSPIASAEGVTPVISISEISSTGIFKYLFNITVTEKTEFLLTMSNGVVTKNGQLVMGGYPDTIKSLLGSLGTNIGFIRKLEDGCWKIDISTKQMTFYDKAGIVEIAKSQLYDKDHSLSDVNVVERERI